MSEIRVDRALLESMLIVKANPKKDWRSWMTGVSFLAKGTVFATNGHVIAVCGSGMPFEGDDVILDVPKTTAAARAYVLAMIDTEAGTISYLNADGVSLGMGQVKVIGPVSVNPAQLIERAPSEPQNKFVFNPGYLGMMEKIAGFFEKKLEHPVYMEIRGNDNCALLEYTGGKCAGFKFMVAPIKD